jgi:hypothetical protein
MVFVFIIYVNMLSVPPWTAAPINSRDFQELIAHNVPAVTDGLPARIKTCVARPGLGKCGRVERGRRSRPSETEPLAAYWRRSIYRPVMCSCAVPPVYIFFRIHPSSFSTEKTYTRQREALDSICE